MKINILKCAVLCSALIPCAFSSELEDFITEAQKANPSVQAAKWRVEQALCSHDALSEFFDPSLFAAVGRADRQRDLPLQTNYRELTDNSTDIQVGAEVPIEPGAYVSAGAGHRILEDEEGHGDLYQTMFGIRVRIPLLRDRGFKTLGLNRAMAMAEYHAVAGALVTETQNVRHSVELAYINTYEQLTNYRIVQEARKRFQELHDEALELAKMKVVPDSQSFQTKMDLQIGQDDEEKARVQYEASLLALAHAIGVTRNLELQGDTEALFAPENVFPLADVPMEEAVEARGEYIQNNANLQYARIQIDASDEEQNDNLDLQFGISAQGEHERNPFGMSEIVTTRRVGGEVALVWRRTLDYRGPRSRKAKYEARILEVQETLRSIEIKVHNEVSVAKLNYDAAKKRLDMVSQGIEAAQQNLAAKQELFRLGETTSNVVTDAQKNLTTILQRRIAAVADLMRAEADYNYAIGYKNNSPQNTQNTQKEGN